MLGKDYMLAIILVNCDGVHRGSRWEDRELREGEGARKATLGSKTGSLSLSYLRTLCLGMRTRGQMNPDLCNAVSKVGSRPLDWTFSANMGWRNNDSVILSPQISPPSPILRSCR